MRISRIGFVRVFSVNDLDVMAKVTFKYLNRRIHLYLGMFCLPWFVMYGISSIAFNHNTWFNNGNDQPGGEWQEVDSWSCSVEVPGSGDIPRSIARELLDTAGLEAEAFGVFRNGPNQLTVYLPNFTEMRQLVYRMDEQRLILRERKKFAQQFWGGLHARGGYQHDSFLDDTWAFVVDVVCVSFLLWVISGLIMWWQSPKSRRGGSVAMLLGFVSFVGFMVWL